ncbi:MAG: histidine--tRNA ligase [Bacteroidetes bacterium RIFCSPLOWO2_02_FULL_36_8]|nr:MAG: histidine--tRNA ligase [Bacteroidetes bacterium RIFCSPLOWO2_02_FULL_36_8]OFY71388.1 MAG: histidine--tRNA ligase [Bacteroidetes bacterium RIFCSPLOWO2_12_FULL_37_12]
MSKFQTSIPRGTRDFPPEVMIKRDYLFEILKSVFEKYSYLPLETPAFEMLSVLEGKGGDENEKLMFRILNSGDFLQPLAQSYNPENLFKNGYTEFSSLIAEKGLRYDLTIPFARFVAMNHATLSFPFKRYQIQPVWRADRPQKGRYREFYQCDIDVAGSKSLFYEAEILVVIRNVFEMLNIKQVTTFINHRKILLGVTQALGMENKFFEITDIIDKMNKIGMEKTLNELSTIGMTQENISTITGMFSIFGSFAEKLLTLINLFPDNKNISEAVSDLNMLYNYAKAMGIEENEFQIDFTLARGLGYYTGVVMETKIKEDAISICGGGRYDDLTGVFGLTGVSGVGISFGAERIYDILEEKKLFPETDKSKVSVLIASMDSQGEIAGVRLLAELRKKQIRAVILPGESKLKKQLAYADKNNILFVLILGPDELANNSFTLKNMTTGEQKIVGSLEEVYTNISNNPDNLKQ